MNKLNVGDLVGLLDGQLTDGVYRLGSEERAIVVEQLIKSKAFRRSKATKLLARFPVLADHLRDGRLCVTTLVELRDVLVEDRLDEILTRAAGKTEDEVKELVAALQPKPAPMELFRLLPPAPVTEFGSRQEPPPVPKRPPAKLAGPTGIRCTATERLEIHHIVPFARGGQPTLENLALRCRAHNRHEAVKDFGTATLRARSVRRKPALVRWSCLPERGRGESNLPTGCAGVAGAGAHAAAEDTGRPLV